VATNLRQGRKDVALFEIGRVFSPGLPLPREDRHLAVVLRGELRPRGWSEPRASADFFAVKGLLEVLSERLGVALEASESEGIPAILHPGRGVSVRLKTGAVGFAGSLHPDLVARWDLSGEVVAAELSLEGLLSAPEERVRFRPLERFPAVTRDLSLVSLDSLPASTLEKVIRQAGGAHLRSVIFVDRYEGHPVPPGKVGLTLSLRFQDEGRTLTSEEVQATMDAIVRELGSSGVELRGE
jgi:phenylalanyl-tRNA synthetase beta chain